MTTTSHANCTHEKTKAARAACRKGNNPPPASEGQKQGATAAARLREKATKATEGKVSEPKAHEGDKPTTTSAFCANGTHDRCPGGGKQWHCNCDCHTVNAE